MKSFHYTRILSWLFVSLVVVSLLLPVFQAQAAVGTPCDDNSVCSPYSCSGGNPATPAPTLEGRCTGPCDFDTATTCDLVKTGLGWGGAKCSGTADNAATPLDESLGVCLELPRTASRLGDSAPATTGASLLALVDTATNWVFAIFVVLSIIFVLLAAFQFVTAGGEATKVGEARQKLIWATVGIIIALLAKGIVPVIRNIVGG